jgi:protein-disulfide isomerase
MKKEMRIAFSALGSLALAAATFAVPATATPAKQSSAQAQQAQTQSVSGRIASVERSSFTLAVGSGSTNPGNQMQQTSPKTMTFMIDKNTTVDGKLKVGANADVTYREDAGNNIAVSVRVSQ